MWRPSTKPCIGRPSPRSTCFRCGSTNPTTGPPKIRMSRMCWELFRSYFLGAQGDRARSLLIPRSHFVSAILGYAERGKSRILASTPEETLQEWSEKRDKPQLLLLWLILQRHRQ